MKLKLLNHYSPLDNHGLEDLAHFTIDTDKINTALIEDDTRDDQEIPSFIATKYSGDFTDIRIRYIKSEFSLKHVGSLKQVALIDCTISYECLNFLPDTLLALTLTDILFEASEVCEIKLPIHLIRLSANPLGCVSDIVNPDQLGELSYFGTRLVPMRAYTHDTERKENIIFQLKKFLHELPALKYFRLAIRGMDTKQIIERLSLNTLDSLVGLSVHPVPKYGNDFPISCLPPTCHALELKRFITLSGQFPETLNKLRISLSEYTKSFEYFWDRFITPLNNLYFLNIIIPGRIHTIDFSYLQFPDRLHTLELETGDAGSRLFLNELPPSIICVSLRCMSNDSYSLAYS
ncbi:unnamed protein product [Ambrosiozyma monospora]|uniref:Unnamed protein product n=1 Tax=Ambrosiozyma monospora TaxID=43982 RepID=A0ACB5TMU5_AMBMO|nr:unnamed protein product [Ambrosiozyma monospora]